MFDLFSWRNRNKRVMVPVKNENKKDGETEENDYIPPEIVIVTPTYNHYYDYDDCYGGYDDP